MDSPTVPEQKPCRKCGNLFPNTTEFFRRKNVKDLTDICKPCVREYERIRDAVGRREAGIPARRVYATEEEKRVARKESSQRWLQRHPEKRRAIKKSWGTRNRDKINAQQRDARQRDPERFSEYDRKRWPARKEQRMQAHKVYYNTRRVVDHDFRLKENMASQIYNALRANKAGRKWETLVGYTLDALKARLEAGFLPGMSWENYGKWHIDHIRPRASFTFTSADDEDFKQCWALRNLQPLWAVDNIRKGSKWQRDI